MNNIPSEGQIDTQNYLIDLIQKTPIFSKIDRSTCKTLLLYFESIYLEKGEELFHQGDVSDGLYILIEGHLSAILTKSQDEQKFIGTILPGEPVGELGALSNQPRSLTICAVSNCKLLKLTRNKLESFSKEYPNVIFEIVDHIIARSQNAIKLLSQRKFYKHIAIIQGDHYPNFLEFIKNLKENLSGFSNIKFSDESENSNSLSQLIIEAEQKNHTLFFVVSENTVSSLASKLNHIGGIYVVVDGDKPSSISAFALEMLSGNHTPYATQYELILMHHDNIDFPKNTLHWLKQAKFTLHHHIRIHDHLAYQRVIRFMRGKSISVIFGGGGNKGWVGAGVVKALIESNIPIDAIGGTSVGGILSACYANTLNYDKAFTLGNYIFDYTMNLFSLSNFTWPIISILSAEKVTYALQSAFKERQLEDLWIPFFCVTCNLNLRKEAVHWEGVLWEKLRATISLPGILPPMVIDGQLHVDGGLINNLPVDCMRAVVGDEGTIVAVSLSEMDEDKKIYHFPPALSFRKGMMHKLRPSKTKFTFPPFFDTFLNSLLLGSQTKESQNKLLADFVVHPNLSEFSSLHLNKKFTDKLIEIGLNEMQKIIKENKIVIDE